MANRDAPYSPFARELPLPFAPFVAGMPEQHLVLQALSTS